MDISLIFWGGECHWEPAAETTFLLQQRLTADRLHFLPTPGEYEIWPLAFSQTNDDNEVEGGGGISVLFLARNIALW